MKLIERIKQTSKNYYSNLQNTQQESTKVGWKNTYAQEIRFQQFLRSFHFTDDITINDLGCGLAGFYTFFSNHFPEIKFTYYGYDILPEMVEEASKKFQDVPNVKIKLIQHANEMEHADYVFASGIFNLKFEVPDQEWYEYITSTVKTMYAMCRKGISFNCLTSYSDKEYMKPELYYTNPGQIFDFCKRNLSRNVALYHDYNEYDFTISVIKEF
ncbi:MAG: class I SAM-dependent methyltransferase [Chitinophagales bacterium]|nr:class I SAM-dependent methyltransferase [Chitinophagales bacterium]MDW8418994.1 class I SAM-dependent methyltransferase [Chitinophagales bacterium]